MRLLPLMMKMRMKMRKMMRRRKERKFTILNVVEVGHKDAIL